MGVKIKFQDDFPNGIQLLYSKPYYKIHKNSVCCIMDIEMRTPDCFTIKATVTGVATTKYEKFDLEKGKRLAHARAELEANLFYKDYIKKFLNRCESHMTAAQCKLLKVQNYIEHKKSYIKKF